jgi:hypothetical protein
VSNAVATPVGVLFFRVRLLPRSLHFYLVLNRTYAIDEQDVQQWFSVVDVEAHGEVRHDESPIVRDG